MSSVVALDNGDLGSQLRRKLHLKVEGLKELLSLSLARGYKSYRAVNRGHLMALQPRNPSYPDQIYLSLMLG